MYYLQFNLYKFSITQIIQHVSIKEYHKLKNIVIKKYHQTIIQQLSSYYSSFPIYLNMFI